MTASELNDSQESLTESDVQWVWGLDQHVGRQVLKRASWHRAPTRWRMMRMRLSSSFSSFFGDTGASFHAILSLQIEWQTLANHYKTVLTINKNLPKCRKIATQNIVLLQLVNLVPARLRVGVVGRKHCGKVQEEPQEHKFITTTSWK